MVYLNCVLSRKFEWNLILYSQKTALYFAVQKSVPEIVHAILQRPDIKINITSINNILFLNIVLNLKH